MNTSADSVHIDGPVDILAILGLTLPVLSDEQLAKITAAAPDGSTVRVASGCGRRSRSPSPPTSSSGSSPSPCSQPPRLRWVHAIASGVDAFLYPAFRRQRRRS